MKQLVLIDAYNVIRTNPSLARFEEQEGTPATIRRFVRMCWEATAKNDHWVLVFDGPGDPETRETDAVKLEVVFSGQLQADELIIDQARYALSQGAQVMIATSDFELYEQGVEKISAHDFYDRLMTRPPAVEVEEGTSVFSSQIIEAMKKAGRLPPGFQPAPPLLSRIDQVLEYYGETTVVKANKAAARIEALLRESAPVTPSPDPEMTVRRALKAILTKGA